MRASLSLFYCLHICGRPLFALFSLSVDIHGRPLLVPFLRFDLFHPTVTKLLCYLHSSALSRNSRSCKKHNQLILSTLCFQSANNVIYFESSGSSHGLSQACIQSCIWIISIMNQAKKKCTGNNFICNVLYLI